MSDMDDDGDEMGVAESMDQNFVAILNRFSSTSQFKYNDVIEQLRNIAAVFDKMAQTENLKETRALKKEIKYVHSWNDIIPIIQNEAGLRGLPKEDIVTLQKIITNEDVTLPTGRLVNLVFSMIPQKDKFEDKFVEELVHWIVGASETIKRIPVIAALLQYLNGLLEYDLITTRPFRNHFIFGIFFSLHRCERFIPWFCRLFIKISSKDLVQRCHILDLTDFLTKDIEPMRRQHIVELLRYFKLLRPDLVPHELMKVKSKGRKLEMDHGLRKRLYDASLRLSGAQKSLIFLPEENNQDIDEAESVHFDPRKTFFSEFLPATLDADISNRTSISNMSTLDLVRAALLRKDGRFLIALDPEALEVFNTWVSLIFLHKFCSYSKKEVKRYEFILNACLEISETTDFGLDAVDDWLPDYLLLWDGVFLAEYVYPLLSYLNPCYLEGASQILESNFLDGNNTERSILWGTLETMFIRWLNMLQQDELVAPMVRALMDFLNTLVSKYIALNDDTNDTLLLHFCSSYEKFLQVVISTKAVFEPYPQPALWWAVVLQDSLCVLNGFFKYYNLWTTSRILSTKSDYSRQMKRMMTDVKGFLGEPGLSSGVEHLFKTEQKQFSNENKEIQNELQQSADRITLGENLQKLNTCLTGQNVHFVGCLENYRENYKHKMVFNKLKLRKIAPELVIVFEKHGCALK